MGGLGMLADGTVLAPHRFNVDSTIAEANHKLENLGKHCMTRTVSIVQLLLAVALWLGLSLNAAADGPEFKKVDMVREFPRAHVYRIDDDEITVGGKVIKRIILGKDSATISYANRGREAVKPSFRFRVINDYGIEVGRFSVNWLFSSLAVDEVRSEDVGIIAHDVAEILEFSGATLPNGWKKPAYLVIGGEGI